MPQRRMPSLLAVWHPDILDLACLPEKLSALADSHVHPIAILVGRPGALHVRRRRELHGLHAFRGSAVPHALDVVMLGERLHERVLRPGDDVDDTAWKI